jgi:hypothetical protein
MDLWIARQKPLRKGVMLPMPNGGKVAIPLHKMGKNELEEIIDWQLEAGGIPKEERGKIREQAEIDYENRIKVGLVRQEIRRRLEGSSPQMSKKGGRWTFTKP